MPKKKPEETKWQTSNILLVLACLVAGGVAGWLIRDANAGAGATPTPDGVSSAPLPSGSAAAVAPACKTWSTKICKEAGEQSEGCRHATQATELLPASACQSAMGEIAATVAKLKEARGSCDKLVKKLCTDLGDKSETCKMVKERTGRFPAQQCEQMLGQYDKVLGELKRMEKANAPLSAELAAKHAKGDGPSFGPEDAKVTVVEYSDFQCPYCAKAAKTLQQLKKRYGKVVRIVFRQYPLPNHPNAMPAAQASLAAHAQGKFWAYHDLLFDNSRALGREDLEKYAKEVGLELAPFRKALDDKTYEQTIKDDMALGEEVGVQGTPTLIVGTVRVKNPTDLAMVSGVIDEQLKAAGVDIPPAPDKADEESDDKKPDTPATPAPRPKAPAPKAPAPAKKPAPAPAPPSDPY